MLKELSEQLPDAGLAVLKEIQVRGMGRDALAKLLDGVAAQCKTTLRYLEIRERQPAGHQ
jgi:hypothetical protein